MKCPSCNASFSELRDLCPSCLMDIRPFKRQNSLTISYPFASYDALLKKFKKETAVPSSPSPEQFIKKESLDSKALQESSLDSTEQENLKNNSKNAIKEESSSILSREEPVFLSDDPDDPRDAAELALKQLLNKELQRQQDRLNFREEPKLNEVNNSDSSVDVDEPKSSSEVKNINELIELDTLSCADSTTNTEVLYHDEDSGDIESLQPSPSESKTLSSALDACPHFLIQEHLEDSELSTLFNESMAILQNKRNEIELSLHQIAGLVDTERINLLFDLSYDSFIHPERDFSFLYNPEIMKNSGLELIELKKTQEKIVFHPPAAALPPLRSRQRHVISHGMRPAPLRQVQLRKRLPLKSVGLSQRFGVFIIDAICVILLGICNGFLLTLINVPNFDSFMVQLLALHPLSILSLLKASIVGIAIMSIAYPLISLSITGTTLGLSVFGLCIKNEDTSDLKMANIIVRSCTFPLILFLVPPFPIFSEDRFLHDYLGRVVVGRRT
ncbi:MAG: RDD family protein [SAR324 cluster bacterium]|uniref:RDD family protein n=1 Tax=SAR324 cluster bacterium TaxID=2024889 RepID=A0A7X9IIN2_9DELT|nr:RDD family protein [SAR324 cluster bacterium]